MASPLRVYLEAGKTWVFACSLDWPGWCRRGKGEDAALEALSDYADRYARVAGASFKPGTLEVVGRLKGNATTDFGAPGMIGNWEHEPLKRAEAKRLVGLLEACWRYFDGVVATAPQELRKGPRGGGRDRDAISQHVREAERAYASRFGLRVLPRTPWPDQRDSISDALLTGKGGGKGDRFPARYAIRRTAWHVLDHAWEIEDRAETVPS